MRCIETAVKKPFLEKPGLINYNMRCIETGIVPDIRFILAVDKLQHEMY